MIKTPEQFVDNSPPSLLLTGAPLSGKTCIAFQFPKVLFYDLDLKLGNAARLFPDKKDWGYVQPQFDENGKEVLEHNRWIAFCNTVNKTAGDPVYETLVVDSLTVLDDWLQAHLIQIGGTGKDLVVGGKKVMTMELWRPFQQYMTQLIMDMKATGKTIIFIAHKQTEKDEVTGTYEYKPMIHGKLRDSIGKLFTDVWECNVETCTPNTAHPNGIKRIVRTIPTPRMMLGNSFGLPANFEFTWQEFEKYMKKA